MEIQHIDSNMLPLFCCRVLDGRDEVEEVSRVVVA